ncbi:hypothetical protein CHS0354_008285 [Potamilus streckersoni]|uniref:Uncharacterized protein n=1 Tax=Potamilus streckersoni TaxID=2493646 RepID=A0AAE0SI86_9BIVA|nr:hypothetical protein CHS0354_008285 [Potamilus streckersoni]
MPNSTASGADIVASKLRHSSPFLRTVVLVFLVVADGDDSMRYSRNHSITVMLISTGVMDPRYVPIPLYLKDLRLSLITGIKGRTKEHWESFQDEQTLIANTALKYDLNYGREDIAIYSNATKYKSLYEGMQPRLYADPHELFRYQTIEINPKYSLDEETIQLSVLKTLKPTIKKPPAVLKKPKISRDGTYISMSGESPPALPARNPKIPRRNVLHGKIHIKQLPSTCIRKTISDTSDHTFPDDIDQYMIKDVSEALKLLRLEKYIPEFADQLIDGRMLQEFDETILKEEFHFTRIEVLRLMNFVKYCHIPT